MTQKDFDLKKEFDIFLEEFQKLKVFPSFLSEEEQQTIRSRSAIGLKKRYESRDESNHRSSSPQLSNRRRTLTSNEPLFEPAIKISKALDPRKVQGVLDEIENSID